MRIGLSAAASWLVAASLGGTAAATASKANTWVTFDSSYFVGDNTSKAIFYPGDEGSREFRWNSREFTVTKVQLCVSYENGTSAVLSEFLTSTTAATVAVHTTSQTTWPTVGTTSASSVATTTPAPVTTMSAPTTTTPASIIGVSAVPHPNYAKREVDAVASAVPTDSNFNSTTVGGNLTVENLWSIATNESRNLYFVAFWNDDFGLQGSSFSQAFTVTSLLPVENLAWGQLNASFTDSTFPFESESLPPAESLSSATTSTPAIASATTAPSATTSSSSGTTGHGLSTGAIAGIAIAGGVVVLSLFTGILWWVLRRRHQRDRRVGLSYGESRSRTQELIAEKEAGAHAALAHPLYSDEALNGGDDSSTGGGEPHGGSAVLSQRTSSLPPELRQTQLQLQPLDHGANPSIADAGLGAAQDLDQRSYSPYSDRPGAAAGSGSPATSSAPLAGNAEHDGTATPTRAITSPLPGRGTPGSNYAHLVEDGMTEHDILRMEEEERELDAAIERARRR